MQENLVIPAQDTQEDTSGNQPPWKQIFIGFVVVISLGIIGFLAYSVGKNSKKPEGEVASIEATPTLGEITSPTPTLSPTPTSTTSADITPTATPTPTPTIKTMIIDSSASLDGFRASNGGGNYGLDIRAGRNLYLVTRGFVSFNLVDVPENATITQATLRLYQYKVVGDPYGVGGNLQVDHLDYGDSLTNEDYSSPTILSSFATLTQNEVIEWKDLNVTSRLKDDLDNDRDESQYRIHFTTEASGGSVSGDFSYFESAENTGSTGNSPQLVIKYY